MKSLAVYQYLIASVFLHNFYCDAILDPVSGWLKVCGKDEKYEIQASVCDKGIWLDEATQLDCICVKGVWILSNGFCDKRWIMVVGDGHCFHIPDKVRSIKYVGTPYEPFASTTFVGPIDLSQLIHISGGSDSANLSSEDSIVIGINPKYPVQRIDKKICLSKGSENKPVHIYRNSGRSSSQWKTLYNRECSTKDKYPYDFHVDVGEMFRDGTIWHADSAIGKCSKEVCSSGTNAQQGRRLDSNFDMSKTTPTVREKRQQGRAVYAYDAELQTAFSIKPGSPEEQKLECMQHKAQVTQDPMQYEIETKEQTIRMMGAHLKPLLLNVTAFEVQTKEFKYFKKAASIFLQSCPGGDERSNITAAIAKMFGWLVWESHDKFTHMESTDDDVHTTILNLTETCIKLDKKLKITESNKPYKSNETCLMDYLGAKGTYYNGTDNTYINFTMPDFLRFDNKTHDLVIEAAWKMILVMYYRCSATFSNSTVEQSYMMEKLQSFFNAKIIKRWYDNKESLKIYTYMLFGYDLNSYMEALDRCAAYSKDLSEIRNWLLRPKQPCTENDLSSSRPKRSTGKEKLKKVWDASGYCIKDFLDPIKQLHYTPEKGCSVPKHK